MESEFIEWLRKQLPDHPCLVLGPGDDAAVLRWEERSGCVVTTDLLTDHVDFDVNRHSPQQIGRKALAVNLSDLAAMAAKPEAAVVSLALPQSGAFVLAQRIYKGILPLAEQFQLAIAGGDTNCWNGALAISVTAIGVVTDRGTLRRDRAKVGDELIVTGHFGGSILGKHFDFTPRVAEALKLNERFEIHAGMDVSDGLSLDISRLVQESGCGAELHLDAIPIADAAYEMSKGVTDDQTPLEHALGDGEDFELILAVPPAEATRLLGEQPLDIPLTRIGRCVKTPGIWTVDETGRNKTLLPRGYEH